MNLFNPFTWFSKNNQNKQKSINPYIIESYKELKEYFTWDNDYELEQLFNFIDQGNILIKYNKNKYIWSLTMPTLFPEKIFYGLTPIDCLKSYIENRYNR